MQQTTLLSIQNATVKHLNGAIFNNLNFSVKQGEHWALVGESGSGKSALLNTIAGKLMLSVGTINRYFADKYIQANQALNPFITFHQFIALVESKHHFRNLSNTTDFYYQQRYNSSDSGDALTVSQYLTTIKTAPGTPASWNLDGITQLLNLTRLLDQQIIKLSNGETKRLMIAAALLKNPLLLLLDNPLSGLDIQTRQEFSQIISKIIKSGITVIMATAASEIPDAITDIGLLQNGNLQSIPKSQFNTNLIPNQAAAFNDATALNKLLTGYVRPPYQWIVKMENVKVRYADKVVLADINWQIKPGERWALLGPNGAGKSTLLSLINGDNPQAYANNIVLFDKKRGSGESIWDIKGKTGFISPELFQYFPTDNSCLQVIESGFYDTIGLFRVSDKAKAAICLQWMQVLEIDQYAHTALKNIPAGAQRLCLLARAMIKNPALLILDEPCQGMDNHQQQHFKNLIDAICRICPLTLIYVTHYQHQIPNEVSFILKLDQGKMVVPE